MEGLCVGDNTVPHRVCDCLGIGGEKTVCGRQHCNTSPSSIVSTAAWMVEVIVCGRQHYIQHVNNSLEGEGVGG